MAASGKSIDQPIGEHPILESDPFLAYGLTRFGYIKAYTPIEAFETFPKCFSEPPKVEAVFCLFDGNGVPKCIYDTRDAVLRHALVKRVGLMHLM